jgi:uncharacterized membrane protein YraQ (UPF0718 family)
MRGVLLRLVILTGGLIALVLAIAAAGDPQIVIQTFSTRFLGIFIEAAPFLLLGTVVSGLIEAFVSREAIARIVPRNKVLSTIVGGLMGFAFPVCECGVVPVARRLMHKGLPVSVAISFLLAAPIMNPIVIASTLAAFGWGPVFVGRLVISAIVAIGIGLIFAFGARPEDVLREPEPALAPASGGTVPLHAHLPTRPSIPARLHQTVTLASGEFFEMGRYLIIGSLLAAGMQTLVSQDVLLALGRGPVISVLTMQVLAFVLSVCSTVDAFLALAFAGTFTTGSILAFLTFGPMVDIKSTLMFLGVFKRRTVLYLILLPLLGTLLITIWINLNLAL